MFADTRRARAQGRSIARLLAGAWRETPPRCTAVAAMAAHAQKMIVGPIIESGGGGLLYHRLQHARGEVEAVPPGLRECWLHQVLDETRQGELLAHALARLQRERIDPLLIKGLAVARLYPRSGLRPSSDLDLVVPAAALQRALAALADLDGSIDVHPDSPGLFAADATAVYARSTQVCVRDVVVRVPSIEDHLRLLALHLLRHGAWRAIWLCDLGLLLDQAERLDWPLVFAVPPWEREAIAAALALAGSVFSLAPPCPALARCWDRGSDWACPSWLLDCLLETWGRGYIAYPQLVDIPATPAELLHALVLRWPNPIRATFALRASFQRGPRLPLQIIEFIGRGLTFMGRRLGRA